MNSYSKRLIITALTTFCNAFDPCVVIANTSLIFLRTAGIPKATTVPAPTSFINCRLENLLSFKLSCSSDIICKKFTNLKNFVNSNRKIITGISLYLTITQKYFNFKREHYYLERGGDSPDIGCG